MPERKIELLDPRFKVHSVRGYNPMIIEAEYIGKVACPACGGTQLRTKDRIQRRIRHATMGTRQTWIDLVLRKYHCHACGRYFRTRMPGILPYRRNTEMFRKEICRLHRDGISQEQLRRSRRIGTATVERWFHEHLELKERMFSGRECPEVLGIDEHFFSKKDGCVTTFCDLKKHRVFELAMGRSERALEPFLKGLKGRERVKVVCIDLSSSYRAIVRKYFPNARIVSDRFHVVRKFAPTTPPTIIRHMEVTHFRLFPVATSFPSDTLSFSGPPPSASLALDIPLNWRLLQLGQYQSPSIRRDPRDDLHSPTSPSFPLCHLLPFLGS